MHVFPEPGLHEAQRAEPGGPDPTWARYRERRLDLPDMGVSLDVSRVRGLESATTGLADLTEAAITAMEAVEAGAIAEPGEHRQVGHYWLRSPERAPDPAAGAAIRGSVAAIREFALRVHQGSVAGADGRFEHVLHVAVGGTTMGAQLICRSLASHSDPAAVGFVDNTDPQGLDRTLAPLRGRLGRTLVSVASKCGWTPTTRQTLLELRAAYDAAGLDFARHAVATTTAGSELDELAAAEGWLATFPLWEWVGGRFSATSAVGLLPLALRGGDPVELLNGAAAMDAHTRSRTVTSNPAMLLALAWHALGNGRGDRRMVVAPYRDRLEPLIPYVQMMVMESLGKDRDRQGRLVNQGLTVYGGRGPLSQHTFFQQLRQGTPDFFVLFVLTDDPPRERAVEVEPGLTLDDFVFGHAESTRNALYEAGRDSITLTVPDVSARTIGALIALFERAAGLYGEMIDINPYDQPGIIKDAARPVIELQQAALAQLRTETEPRDAAALAAAIGRPEAVETVFKLLDRLARAQRAGVVATPAGDRCATRFWIPDAEPAA